MRQYQSEAEDPAYIHANALYYQSRRDRLRGCNKDSLRRLLAFADDEFSATTGALLSRGWIMESGSDVMLTSDGWHAVLESRRRKTHAAVRFLSTAVHLTGVGSRGYKFEYVLRDNLGRQFTHSVTVSITDELCRRWQLLDMEHPLNDDALVRLLRRLAFDHVASRLAKQTLCEHESFNVGGLVGTQPCRYNTNDLPETESDEYEVEWQRDVRHAEHEATPRR